MPNAEMDQQKMINNNLLKKISDRKLSFLLYCIQAVSIGAILYIGLDLSARNIEVPFVFSGDAFHFLTITKGIIDSGWWWTIGHLSAPFTLHMVSFPVAGYLDFSIVKLLTFFNQQPGTVLNLFWLLTFVFTGLICTWSLKRLGISRSVSFALGTLFAFIPHAFYRGEGHLMLVFYLVPLVSSLSVIIIRGEFHKLSKLERFLFYAGCMGIGLNYAYNAFFSIFVLVIAGLISLFYRGRDRSASAALMACCVILISLIISLSPTIYSWRADAAAKQNIQIKSAAETDIYGLKLRHLITPIDGHPLSPWRHFLERTNRANFPLENENATERLGTLGSVGFMLLIIVSMVGLLQSTRFSNILLKLQPVASLNLSVFLLATIGGFGSIFNLLIGPHIRCYNRVAVFIAFFSYTAIGIVLSSFDRKIKTLSSKLLFYFLLIIMIVSGIFDVTLFARSKSMHASAEQQYWPLKQFVGEIEKQLPDNAMIYQMPYTPYPHTPALHRMLAHQHLAPYLMSKHLRWSWPSLSGRSMSLARCLSEMTNIQELVRALIVIGYDGIWIDRYGYEDNGEQVISSISSLAHSPVLQSQDKRFVFISLQEEKKKLYETTDYLEIDKLRNRFLNLKRTILNKPLPEDAFTVKMVITNLPSELKVSEVVNVCIKIKNTSSYLLPSEALPGNRCRLGLSYRWNSSTGEKISGYESRAYLPEDLEPGGELLLNIPVKALDMPGEYILEVDMVQEAVAWFGDKGSKTAVAKIKINAY